MKTTFLSMTPRQKPKRLIDLTTKIKLLRWQKHTISNKMGKYICSVFFLKGFSEYKELKINKNANIQKCGLRISVNNLLRQK